ncbi:hypothetical protein BKA69DRAFT_586695 [Paraphysoderma sedebokerense]|nr:hypothetical protein BKA69DRAFT_586695 [Paraphysoderma sedebokerense]
MLDETSITNAFAIHIKRIYYRHYTAILDATDDHIQSTKLLCNALNFALEKSIPSVICPAAEVNDLTRPNATPTLTSSKRPSQYSLYLFYLDVLPPVENDHIFNALEERDTGDFSLLDGIDNHHALYELFVQAFSSLMHRDLFTKGWIDIGKEVIKPSLKNSITNPPSITLQLNPYLSPYNLILQPLFMKSQYQQLSIEHLELLNTAITQLVFSLENITSLSSLFPEVVLAPFGLKGYLLPHSNFKHPPCVIEAQLKQYTKCFLPADSEIMEFNGSKASSHDTVKVLVLPGTSTIAHVRHPFLHFLIRLPTILSYPRSLVLIHQNFPSFSNASKDCRSFGESQPTCIKSLAHCVIGSTRNPIPSSLLKVPSTPSINNVPRQTPLVEVSAAAPLESAQVSFQKPHLDSNQTLRQPRKRVSSGLATSTIPEKSLALTDSSLSTDRKESPQFESVASTEVVAAPIKSPMDTHKVLIPSPEDKVESLESDGRSEPALISSSLDNFGVDVGLFDTDTNMIGASFDDIDMNLDMDMQFDMDLKVTDDDWNFFDDKKKAENELRLASHNIPRSAPAQVLDPLEALMDTTIPQFSQSELSESVLSTQDACPETVKSSSPLDENPLATVEIAKAGATHVTESQPVDLDDSNFDTDPYAAIIPSPFVPLDASTRTDIFGLPSPPYNDSPYGTDSSGSGKIVAHLSIITLPPKYCKGNKFEYLFDPHHLLGFQANNENHHAKTDGVVNWVEANDYGPNATPKVQQRSTAKREPLSSICTSNQKSKKVKLKDSSENFTNTWDVVVKEQSEWKAPKEWNGRWQSPWGDILPPGEKTCMVASPDSSDESSPETSELSSMDLEPIQGHTTKESSGLTEVDIAVDGTTVKLRFIHGVMETIELLESQEVKKIGSEQVVAASERSIKAVEVGTMPEKLERTDMELVTVQPIILPTLSDDTGSLSSDHTSQGMTFVTRQNRRKDRHLPTLVVSLFYHTSLTTLLALSHLRKSPHSLSMHGTLSRSFNQLSYSGLFHLLEHFRQILNGTNAFDDTANAGAFQLKGPLSVGGLYETTDSEKSLARFGKFQIRKKKTTDPIVEQLPHYPDITVAYTNISNKDMVDEISGTLSISSLVIPFWEKLGLEPISGKKAVKYLAIAPSAKLDEKESLGYLEDFLVDIGAIYESCNLGSHRPLFMSPTQTSRYGSPRTLGGLSSSTLSHSATSLHLSLSNASQPVGMHRSLPRVEAKNIVDMGPLGHEETEDIAALMAKFLSQLRVSFGIVRSKLEESGLGGVPPEKGQIIEENDDNKVVVVYVTIPFDDWLSGGKTIPGLKDSGLSYTDIWQLWYEEVVKMCKPGCVYLKIIPMGDILTQTRKYLASLIKSHAFDVYDCIRFSPSSPSSVSTNKALYSPAFSLVRPPPTKIDYSLKTSLSPLESVYAEEVELHVAFKVCDNELIMIFTDDKRELWECFAETLKENQKVGGEIEVVLEKAVSLMKKFRIGYRWKLIIAVTEPITSSVIKEYDHTLFNSFSVNYPLFYSVSLILLSVHSPFTMLPISPAITTSDTCHKLSYHCFVLQHKMSISDISPLSVAYVTTTRTDASRFSSPGPTLQLSLLCHFTLDGDNNMSPNTPNTPAASTPASGTSTNLPSSQYNSLIKKLVKSIWGLSTIGLGVEDLLKQIDGESDTPVTSELEDSNRMMPAHIRCLDCLELILMNS